ncbi:VirD4-like conjugal transfer protein, CD1115 family [Enterococcus pallens]|uniref:Type IV secretion system protein n=1 Tax=Enterococcus pallens ATCC BAA-351 TaxID=1158607 RepID=R2PSN5_9ENTE|nr:type IV secretory system conjugative DNA transfer family protein [Enterococcus pallens]EOH86318.1 type IV secretion system protein [Enterococcus pallens ATCC BAA-351]EOU09461.1 type IV secretion system protein [Enterococcus pallens ATCC BAA-351]OJG77542.1 type IV secretion system protein [Enterococcus pallens]
MNKEYKQWKKHLANPYFLSVLGLLFCLFGVLLINFIFNGIMSLQGIIPKLNSFVNEGGPVPFQPRLYWLGKPLITYTPFLLLYWGLIGFNGLIVGKKIYSMRIAYKDINLLTKGSEKFTTLKELKEQYKMVPLNDEEYEGKSGIPVATFTKVIGLGPWKKEEKYVFIDTKNTNSLTIGGTQSGKTSLFSYPSLDLIMRAKEKDSVIVNDLKGDMLKNTKSEFERFGYDVYCLNLVDPTNGIHYNPLDLVKQAYMRGDTTKAQMLANSLSFSLYHNPNAKEPMWEEASISLLNALILAICEIGIQQDKTQVINMYAVTSMLEELGAYPDEKGNTALDKFFDQLPVTSVARKQYGTIKFSQGITRSGIFTGTMAKLKNYTYDAIAKLTLDSDFNLEDLGYGKKPIALFIVYPDWNDSNYSIISTFLSQINEVLAERATLTGEGTKRRVRYWLEEAANIPAIDGLSRAMNVGLQRNLVYHLIIQSYSQLDDKYGDKLSKAITGACGNQIYIMSDEYDDAEYFSKKIGDKTIIKTDRHGDPLSTDKSYGENEEGRNLLTANELRDLREGEWVLDRTKMRRDLNGNKITPYPIFASIDTGTNMTFHYEYLMPRFDGKLNLSELELSKKGHKEINLVDYIVKWKRKSADHKDQPQKNRYEDENEEENLMKTGVESIDSVSLDTKDTTRLEDKLGPKIFGKFLQAAYLDRLTVQEKERLSQFTSIEQLKVFCNSDNRPNLKKAYLAYVQSSD